MRSTDEIRDLYLEFFQDNNHKLLPSASLIPATFDSSVLLTTAGMHPLKPYFLGEEKPPAARLTSCQKCFRSTDIENVGNTARHLTFFEMLGNFSIGDYFKEGAIEFAWRLSTEGFGFSPDQIKVTVFKGDDELGLGPDQEAIDAWKAVGVAEEQIVLLSREDNFWQAGPTGPCGPCTELYYDRGPEFGPDSEQPGDDGERYLEYWNLVFMQYNQDPVGTLTPLPSNNIDTGLGLNRMAAILQDKESVFETDQFKPLIELSEELSGKKYGSDEQITRAIRILADHSRAMNFLIADGVVPSNEDRGYILRRTMRRAIRQGRLLNLEPGFLPKYSGVVTQLMGEHYNELFEQADVISKWLRAEEESFGRTLDQGDKLLESLIKQAVDTDSETVSADEVFKLHDTYGFPVDLTQELLTEQGLTVDRSAFDVLMDQQRSRAKGASSSKSASNSRKGVIDFAHAAEFETEFVGYQSTTQQTTVGAVDQVDGQTVIKLAESPFYPEGGGQVSDTGVVRCGSDECLAEVADVVRIGSDQALKVDLKVGKLEPGQRVEAVVDSEARRATACNHTATHLLQAALKATLGDHVRQAGSAVRPDKLRFDFNHTQALTPEELKQVEDDVNEWILANYPVTAITTTLDEAKKLGAMALFGEKYGEIVRMVEVGDGDFSRELCGGTHVAHTAEIGVFKIVSETSSAANVRRIEAVTGPVAIQLLRDNDQAVESLARDLKTDINQLPVAVKKQSAKIKELEKQLKSGKGSEIDTDQLLSSAEQVGEFSVVTAKLELEDAELMLQVIDTLKAKLKNHVVVLGCSDADKVSLIASVDPAAVKQGLKAGELVKAAAQIVGGGGGGRDTLARAGGSKPEKLAEAIDAATGFINEQLG